MAVIYSIFAAHSKFCLYLHSIHPHSVMPKQSTTPIADTVAHIASVRIFLHFFPFTRSSYVSTKTELHSDSVRAWVYIVPSKSYRQLPHKQTLSLILIAIHCAHAVLLTGSITHDDRCTPIQSHHFDENEHHRFNCECAIRRKQTTQINNRKK